MTVLTAECGCLKTICATTNGIGNGKHGTKPSIKGLAKCLDKTNMWKQYRDTDYYLSPAGKIIRRYKKGDKPLKGYMHWKRNQHGNSYYVFKCYGSEVVLSRAMWETFRGEIPSGCLIIHKNGIKTMNNLDNLICVDKKKNGIMTGGRTRIAQTIVDKDTGKTYQGTRAAGKALHISRQTVSEYCNGRVKNPMFNLSWGEKKYAVE